jgi:hypothetical protein
MPNTATMRVTRTCMRGNCLHTWRNLTQLHLALHLAAATRTLPLGTERLPSFPIFATTRTPPLPDGKRLFLRLPRPRAHPARPPHMSPLRPVRPALGNLVARALRKRNLALLNPNRRHTFPRFTGRRPLPLLLHVRTKPHRLTLLRSMARRHL